MMRQESHTPPRWPLKILRAFLKPQYVEEIEGDMEEIFRENTSRYSLAKARRLYVVEMLKLLRPVLLRSFAFTRFLSPFGMYGNYYKVSIRGLMKQPLTSFINVFGLAAAIGFCVYSYAYTQWALARDQFHKNKDVVFMATFFAEREGTLHQYGQAPRPLGDLLRQDFSQVRNMCRVDDRNVVVKQTDKLFNERVRLVDPSFLEMFTFPLKWGSSSSLSDINSIVLSERISVKYFGDENPIGQVLTIKFSQDRSKEFKVTGVAAAFTPSRSMDFGFLINRQNLATVEPGYQEDSWALMNGGTFVQVSARDEITEISQGMEKYRKLQNKAVSEDMAIVSFAFEPLATIHAKTELIRDDIFREGTRGNMITIAFMIGMSLLFLALACFNYINIAIATTVKRLKELGVRKTIGANRWMVIIQFLSENMVVTLFASIIGLLMGKFIIVPWFEDLWNFSMNFRLADPRLWIYLPGILVITGLASGIYPAIYISRFQTVNILKGSLKFGHKNPVTKIFLGLQLVVACVFITSAIMFTRNADYLAQRSWGYENREVMYAVMPDALSYEQLRDKMVNAPGVTASAGSAHHVAMKQQAVLLHFPDREFEAELLAVDAPYFKTLGIEIIAGRGFLEPASADLQAAVVNETMVKNLGWAKPLGQQFRIDSVEYEVIGVVKDFHSYSFDSPLKPTMFRRAQKDEFRYLSLKVSRGKEKETYESLMQSWAILFKDTPFTGGYQEDVWGSFYTDNAIYGHVFRVFATVAVILAALGLYGLVSLNVSGRVKEFSIRKVLGAKVGNLASTVMEQYSLMIIGVLTVGLPLSYFTIEWILDFASAYHIPVTFWNISEAGIFLLIILFLTVLSQIVKVNRSNPIDGLKVE